MKWFSISVLFICILGSLWLVHLERKDSLPISVSEAPSPAHQTIGRSASVQSAPSIQSDREAITTKVATPLAVVRPAAIARSLRGTRPPVMAMPPAPGPLDAPVVDAVVPEPVARQALAFVGANEEAESVWMTAINDQNLSPEARQNLIEDLNETGFNDPKNLTSDDLPLIENRIALIEDVGPSAADDVNLAAFQEAYKDLLNMRSKLVSR